MSVFFYYLVFGIAKWAIFHMLLLYREFPGPANAFSLNEPLAFCQELGYNLFNIWESQN